MQRDLSPENVMIDDNGCLIIDLGMCLRVPYTTTTCTSGEPRTIVPLEPARSSSQDHQTQLQLQQQQQSLLRKLLFMPQGACGKLPYMSPEIYRNRHAFDGAAVDVWCAGTILFCMLTGNRSYHRPHATDAQFYWMTHGLSQLLHDWNIELSPQGLHLLRNMLQVDPRLRLTIDEVLNHAWFQLPHEPINVQRIMS
jgi:serine/threonine protein kinase